MPNSNFALHEQPNSTHEFLPNLLTSQLKRTLGLCLCGTLVSAFMLSAPSQAYTIQSQGSTIKAHAPLTKEQLKYRQALEEHSQQLSQVLPPMQKPLLNEIARLTYLSSPAMKGNANGKNSTNTAHGSNTSVVLPESAANNDAEPLFQAENLTPDANNANNANNLASNERSYQAQTQSQAQIPEQTQMIEDGVPNSTPLLMIFGADKFYTFLGCVNCAPTEALSIWNPYGPYGNANSQYSIWSSNFEFGNESAQVCPWNKFGRQPPFLIDSFGKIHGRLTLNRFTQERNNGKVAQYLYANYQQIRIDPQGAYHTLFKTKQKPVLVIPETQSHPQQALDLHENLEQQQ